MPFYQGVLSGDSPEVVPSNHLANVWGITGVHLRFLGADR